MSSTSYPEAASSTHAPSSSTRQGSRPKPSSSKPSPIKKTKQDNRVRKSDGSLETNCCKIVDKSWADAVDRAEAKETQRTGPKPWIERKLVVGIVIALFTWSSYDFLGNILRKALLKREDALVDFPGAVVLTVVYCLLWIMFVWTYVKLLFTGPGFAADYIPHSEVPLPSDPPPESLPNNPYINTRHSIHSTSYSPNTLAPATGYPPSVAAPTSFRPSMEQDRVTYQSVSHEGEIDERGETQEVTIGVPYDSMPKRARSASTAAIPPTPGVVSPSEPSTPHELGGIMKKPPLPLPPRKSSNASSLPPDPAILDPTRLSSDPPRPSEASSFKPFRFDRRSSSSRRTDVSPPASPGIPTFSNTRYSSSSDRRPTPLKISSGFRFESSSTVERAKYVHSRTISEGSKTPNVPTTMPTPSLSAPQTPTINLSGRTEPIDASIPLGTAEDVEVRRLSVYTADLPPEAGAGSAEERYQRRPSDQPVLDPYYRYCSRDGIVKPMRAHHCRICNTCVLGYDHHCPWVGGCVGARNRKFFVVFCFWAAIYTLYTLGILISAIVNGVNPHTRADGTKPPSTIDANSLALLIATTLFALFTCGMFFTHLHLLSVNASTVEWHGITSMKERERATISAAVPVCGCLGISGQGSGGLLGRAEGDRQGNMWKDEGTGLKGYRGRKELRERWDRDWGRVGKEGNLWWLGSKMENWEAVMGKNGWTWLLPVGNTSTLGLSYPTNPRFDEHGRWMRRRDWPEELR